MYLAEFDVTNIKCFEHVHLAFPHRNGDYSGWNVLLGGNGTGKSTLLQAIAIALVGPVAGQRLYNPSGWNRKNCSHGEIRACLLAGSHDAAPGKPRKKPYTAAFAVTGTSELTLEGHQYDQPQLVQLKSDQTPLSKGPYAANRSGWLACGYGPFRRLTGMGGNEYDLFYGAGRGVRFATLFREGAAITNCTDWLVSLYSQSIDSRQPEQKKIENDLSTLRAVINSLLPGSVQIINIDSRNVYFSTIGGVEVTAPELSDGYRSFLALAVDLLRHVHESVNDLATIVDYNQEETPITLDGVVLIDEVDAHLHPRWQREIGFRLCRAFPKMQFIVTSHSPFVAQVANDNALFVLRQAGEREPVTVNQPIQSIRGWRVDQVLTDQLLFNMEGTRDEETEALLRQHSKLVARREWQQLTDDERLELIELEKKLADRLTGPGEDLEQRQRQADMAEFVNKTVKQLKERS